MSDDPVNTDRTEGRTTIGWPIALALGVAMFVAAFVLFAIIPNWLLDTLELRVTQTGRDLILLAWWGVAFVAACVLFVKVQRVGN